MDRKLIQALHLRRSIAGLILGLLAALPVQAATLPSLVVPEGVGVNIHFSKGNEKDLDLIAAAGVKVVRTDFTWDQIERYQGIYDWSAYDELAANLAKRGIRPLFILDYSNGLYEETISKRWLYIWPYSEVMSPQYPRSIEAFSRWAAEAAKHFHKYGVIWEIWNEPNIKFWKPAPDVAAYSRLAISACNAIHQADPNATVVAPASSKFPWEFLEGFFRAGALNCLDGVSVHPYREQLPETVLNDYARMRKLVGQYTPAHRKEPIPILSGEWGYATVKHGRLLQDQADFLVRMQLLNLLYSVPLSVWYDWKNDGLDSTNHEHNFGVVNADLTPKPAYIALKTFTAQLAGYRPVQLLNLGNNIDYALLFVNAQGQGKIAVWTSGREHNIRIAAPPPHAAKLSLTNWQGQRSEIRLEGNWIPVHVTNSPAYIGP